MVIFPSSESQTDSTQPPWVSLCLCLLAVLGYLFLLVPQQNQYSAKKKVAELTLDQSLERHYLQGLLPQSFYRSAREDHTIVGLPENRDLFSEESRTAYQAWSTIPKPHEQLQKKGPLWKLVALFVPHAWPILLLGIFCFICQGFLFEHLFDRQLLAALFVVSAFGWLAPWPFLPDRYQPSLIFGWSHTLNALLLGMWLCFPRSDISLTIHLWFVKIFTFKPTIPTGFFALFFLAGSMAYNLVLSDSSAFYNPWTMLPIVGEGLVFAVLLSVIARKEKAKETPEQMINRQIATAESQFDRQRPEEAFSILRDLLNANPDSNQLHRIAEIAWKHHDNEIARQAYNVLLKNVLHGDDTKRLITLIEEMIYRDIAVAAHALNGAVQKAFKGNLLPEVQRMLPLLENHQEIPHEQLVQAYEHLATKLLAMNTPDRQFLFECQSWFEKKHPESPYIQQIRDYLQSTSIHNMTPMDIEPKVNRHLDIQLMDISNGSLRLCITGGKEQVVPWTAVEGIFGCHVASGARGYYGCIFLKFKRKLFACNFNRQSIMIKDRYNQNLSFENTWSRLEQYVPEDVPFQNIEEFPELLDTAEIADRAEAFISQ